MGYGKVDYGKVGYGKVVYGRVGLIVKNNLKKIFLNYKKNVLFFNYNSNYYYHNNHNFLFI